MESLSKPRTCLNQTLSKPRTCLNQTLSKPKTCLSQSLSKPKTCLSQTDFTVPSTKCLYNFNLCTPNTCLNWTNLSVPKGFGLDRFYCKRHFQTRIIRILATFTGIFFKGKYEWWSRQTVHRKNYSNWRHPHFLCTPNTCLNWTNLSVPKGFGLDRFYCKRHFQTRIEK
jgi:hypothetical protein